MPETKTATQTTETKTEEKKSSLLSDILSIIGFAILFIILIWGLVHLVSLASSSLSSIFSRPAASIEVTAPAQAISGQPATISWSYSPKTSGSYALVYECKTGLSFQTAGATSTSANIPCGVAYTLGNASNTVAITPKLSATSSIADTLSIVFIPSQSGSQVQGSAAMTVNPAAQISTKPQTTSTKPASTYTAPHYTGPADLSVRIISESVDQTGAAVVSFDIANVGGSNSGSYYFTAQLPTAQNYPYQSPKQAPLAPGSHIVDTLRFTDVESGGGLFSVSVEGNDSNTANNYASTEISATSYTSYDPAQYTVYPSYTY